MNKLLSLFVLALTISWMSLANAEPVKALINLEFIEDTEITSGVLCYGEENCHRWSTYYLFQAQVIRVIDGQLPEDSLKVIFGRHALKKTDIPNVLATIEPLESGNQFSVQYKVIELEWDHGL